MNNLIELQDVNLIRNGKSLLKEINWQENRLSSNCLCLNTGLVLAR